MYLVSRVTPGKLEFRELLLGKLQCIGAYINIMQKKHTQKKKHILKATTTTKLTLRLTKDHCKHSHL